MHRSTNITRRAAIKAITATSLFPVIGCNQKSPDTSTPPDEIVTVPEPLDLPIPLLHRLHEVDDLIASKFPAKYDPGMGQLGLLLSRKLKNGGYWCTPTNSLEFGRTGGDGVHFSLVQIDGEVTAESPVVVTVPQHFGDPRNANAIVGSSLINFIRFGLLRGYFAMEQLIYKRDLALEAFSSSEWQPTEEAHYSVGLGVDETKRQIMQLIARELKITPLSYTKNEFESLQNQFLPMLSFRHS